MPPRRTVEERLIDNLRDGIGVGPSVPSNAFIEEVEQPPSLHIQVSAVDGIVIRANPSVVAEPSRLVRIEPSIEGLWIDEFQGDDLRPYRGSEHTAASALFDDRQVSSLKFRPQDEVRGT